MYWPGEVVQKWGFDAADEHGCCVERWKTVIDVADDGGDEEVSMTMPR